MEPAPQILHKLYVLMVHFELYEHLGNCRNRYCTFRMCGVNHRTWESITKISAPVPRKIISLSNVGSKKSICPGKSQIWKLTKELLDTSSLQILLVLSRNSVSLGDILWKTTFWMDDFPLLRRPINRIRGLTSAFRKSLTPNPAHQRRNNGV